MAIVETTRVLMRRLAPKHRKIIHSRTRTDIHMQKKKNRVYHKLTTAERKSKSERRTERRKDLNARLKACDEAIWGLAVSLAQDFGFDAFHWYHHMMQNARIAKGERKVNRWNAFVALILAQINAALPEGVPKKKASDPDVAPALKMMWDSMSEEERDKFTSPRVQEMKEAWEIRDTMKHDTTIAAFHDIRTTLLSLENQIKNLYLRTGLEVLMFAVRSSDEHYNRPFVLSTSDKGTSFFQTCFNQLPSVWVTRFEAYCLLGIDGLKSMQAVEVSRLKAACSALILEQVRTVAAPANIPKMHYQDFDEHFTQRHHLIYENWPIPSFCTPHKLGLTELRTLYDRLTNTNAPPLFRILTAEEWVTFKSTASTRAPAPITATSQIGSIFIADGPSSSAPDVQPIPIDPALLASAALPSSSPHSPTTTLPTVSPANTVPDALPAPPTHGGLSASTAPIAFQAPATPPISFVQPNPHAPVPPKKQRKVRFDKGLTREQAQAARAARASKAVGTPVAPAPQGQPRGQPQKTRKVRFDKGLTKAQAQAAALARQERNGLTANGIPSTPTGAVSPAPPAPTSTQPIDRLQSAASPAGIAAPITSATPTLTPAAFAPPGAAGTSAPFPPRVESPFSGNAFTPNNGVIGFTSAGPTIAMIPRTNAACEVTTSGGASMAANPMASCMAADSSLTSGSASPVPTNGTV
ncbi:hypothetical protein QCA50_007434 [Cerrena zonata]|uniref:Uncharacterized protein n=1 Tax=Cerrena zonata TaxID=2478898 RepID=A0AAW0GJH9_9APHY